MHTQQQKHNRIDTFSYIIVHTLTANHRHRRPRPNPDPSRRCHGCVGLRGWVTRLQGCPGVGFLAVVAVVVVVVVVRAQVLLGGAQAPLLQGARLPHRHTQAQRGRSLQTCVAAPPQSAAVQPRRRRFPHAHALLSLPHSALPAVTASVCVVSRHPPPSQVLSFPRASHSPPLPRCHPLQTPPPWLFLHVYLLWFSLGFCVASVRFAFLSSFFFSPFFI